MFIICDTYLIFIVIIFETIESFDVLYSTNQVF